MTKRIVSILTTLSVFMMVLISPMTSIVSRAEGSAISWGTPQEWSSNPAGTTTQIHGMVYGSGKFVIPVGNDTVSQVLVSANGVDWTSAEITGAGPKGLLQDAAYNGTDTFVAVGNFPTNPQINYPTVLVSTNGAISWSSDNIAFYDADGSTPFTGFATTPRNFKCVIWDGQRFLAATNAGQFFVSTDGLSWTLVRAGNGNINAIAYSGTTYVAVANGGVVLYSTDRTTWNAATSGTTQHLLGVAYGAGRFIAVGAGGTILTSTDGAAWSPVTPGGFSTLLNDVRWLNNQFVAVGATGKVLVSASGDLSSSWTDSSISSLSTSSKAFWGVAYDGVGTYVAAGDGGFGPNNPNAGGLIVSSPCARMTASPATLTEAESDNGSLASTLITVNLYDANLAPELLKEDVSIIGLPEGFDYSVERNENGTQFTVNLTGSAISHRNSDDTSIRLSLSADKVVRNPSDTATGALVSNDIAINFISTTISAGISANPSVLNEASTNDGSISERTIFVNITGGKFKEAIQKQDVVVTGLPSGMNYNVSHMKQVNNGDLIWNFDSSEDLSKWLFSSDMVSPNADSGVPIIESGILKAGTLTHSYMSGDQEVFYSDHYMYLNPILTPDFSIDASSKKYVQIRMKNNTESAAGEIYCGNDPNGTDLRNIVFSTVPNSDFTTYTIDLTNEANWSGNIRFFRVDPGWKPGTVEIDYIRVCSSPILDSDNINQLQINISGNATNHEAANNTTAAITVSSSKIIRGTDDTSTDDLTCAVDFRFTDRQVAPPPTVVTPVIVTAPAAETPVTATPAELQSGLDKLQSAANPGDARNALDNAAKLLDALKNQINTNSSSGDTNQKITEAMKIIQASSTAISRIQNSDDALKAALDIIDSVKELSEKAGTAGIPSETLGSAVNGFVKGLIEQTGTFNVKEATTTHFIIDQISEKDIINTASKASEVADKLNASVIGIAGSTHFNAELTINTNLKADTAKASVQLPASLLLSAEIGKLGTLGINMGNTDARIPVNAVTVKEGDNLILTANVLTPAELDSKTKALTGDKRVYEYSLKVGTKNETKFSKPIELSIPYKPAGGESGEHLTVFYVNEGRLENMAGVYYEKEGVVRFSTNHFSKFAIKENKVSFTDLGGYGWAAKNVEVLASKGIIKGVGKNKFSPSTNVTRAQLFTLIVNTFGLMDSTAKCSFSDIKASDWYYDEFASAVKAGLLEDGKGKIKPAEYVKIEEIFEIISYALVKFKGMSEPKDADAILKKFTDKDKIPENIKAKVALVVKAGIIQGTDKNTLQIGKEIDRAQAAAIIYRLLYLN